MTRLQPGFSPDITTEQAQNIITDIREHMAVISLPSPSNSHNFPATERDKTTHSLKSITTLASNGGLTHLADAAEQVISILSESEQILPSQVFAAEAGLDFAKSYLECLALTVEKEAIPEAIMESLYITYKGIMSRKGSRRDAKECLAGSPAPDNADKGKEAPQAEHSLSVLVADDEEIIRFYMEDIIENMGHRVVLAHSGSEAIRLLDRDCFDLVFTDINMPGADGIQVLQHTKKVQPNAEVIIITGYASVENAAQAVHHGAYEYLTKPFDHSINIQAVIKRAAQQLLLRRENRMLMHELSLRNLELKQYVSSLEKTLKELKEKQQALIHSDRMASLGVLAAGVAHEINNPTTFIRGNLQTLKKFWGHIIPLLQEKATENNSGKPPWEFIATETPGLLHDMLVGTERITRIVSGLRSFAHPNHTEEMTETDIHTCIQDALSLLYGELKNRVEIVSEFGELPPLQLAAHQLTQVLVNLLINAAHATEDKPDACIRIVTTCNDTDAFIKVIDNGNGINDDTLAKIFNPFYTTKPVGKGTGLGLSIAMGIAHQHGGDITVKSHPGEGSEFTIRLPLPQANRQELDEATTTTPHILMVDDDLQFLDLTCKTLENETGFRTSRASNGFQAILKAGEDRPEVILLDILMPDLDGFDVIQSLKSNPITSHIPIIAITGLSSANTMKRLEESGTDAILTKPVDYHELIALIEKTITTPRSTTEPDIGQ